MGHSPKMCLSSCNHTVEKTILECGMEFVSFKTKKQSNLWIKLHKKKCDICKIINFSQLDNTYTDVRV